MMSKHVAIALVLAFCSGIGTPLSTSIDIGKKIPSQLINSEKIQELVTYQIS